ncbi:MAG: hypothetical protein IJZ10_07885, partial [Thermoguttaceae bacterium]|nr:hypothetical protein [Thermoguttaceae bacterium]
MGHFIGKTFIGGRKWDNVALNAAAGPIETENGAGWTPGVLGCKSRRDRRIRLTVAIVSKKKIGKRRRRKKFI